MLALCLDERKSKQKLEELYRYYRQDMFVIANKILDNVENAEDAVHDAFVVIARKVDVIDDIYAKETAKYIRVIVKNKAIRIYNRCKRGEVLTDDFNYLSYLSEKLPDVESQIEKKEVLSSVNHMLAELPEKYRQVLYLYYYNNASYAEIADVLDLKEANVRQIAKRAKKAMKAKIHERGLEYE